MPSASYMQDQSVKDRYFFFFSLRLECRLAELVLIFNVATRVYQPFQVIGTFRKLHTHYEAGYRQCPLNCFFPQKKSAIIYLYLTDFTFSLLPYSQLSILMLAAESEHRKIINDTVLCWSGKKKQCEETTTSRKEI